MVAVKLKMRQHHKNVVVKQNNFWGQMHVEMHVKIIDFIFLE